VKQTRSLWTERDVEALTWIAEQYAVHLDHLQVLLGSLSNRPVTKSTVSGLLRRWKQAGWVETQRIRATAWVWPTRETVEGLGLPYGYKDIRESETHELNEIAAINEVRLKLDNDAVIWVCKRDLLRIQESGRVLPDAEMHGLDGPNVAIKVGFPAHADLAKQLIILREAEDSYGDPYSAIWCYATDSSALEQIRERCAPDVQITVDEEACRIVIKGQDLPEIPRVGHRRSRSRRMSTRETQEDGELTTIKSAVPWASDGGEHPPVGSSEPRMRKHRLRMRSRRMERVE
jgi:hypothetical protein